MKTTIAGVTFSYHDYDPRGDTLFLGVDGPSGGIPARAHETPEGHVVEYDDMGRIVALELVNVRRALDGDGEIRLTCPQEHHVALSSLRDLLVA